MVRITSQVDLAMSVLSICPYERHDLVIHNN